MSNNMVHYQSEIGMLAISASEEAITAIHFVEAESISEGETSPVLQECLFQIDAYFRGELTSFDLPLQFIGTPFQIKVWRELTRIPYAKTISYAELADHIGKPGAFRAVGNANGKNPISIIVPCHRVIGTNGDLTGYGGGLWRKEWLLAHELRIRSQEL